MSEPLYPGSESKSRETAGVQIASRFVPFPRSISEQAQAALVELACPRKARSYPASDDFEAWAALKEESNRTMASNIQAKTVGADASVETLELGGTVVHLATPATLGASAKDRVYIDIHGGSLIYGSGEPCRLGARAAAATHGVPTYSIDYRTPPEHPYPAALDDCVSVYRSLLQRYAPENIAIGGISAGGNLAAALVLRARDEGLPLPASLVLLTHIPISRRYSEDSAPDFLRRSCKPAPAICFFPMPPGCIEPCERLACP